MTNSSVRFSWGGPLSEDDYAGLDRSWITRDLADQALLRRVTSVEGAELVGRKDNGSFGGIIFPYVAPGADYIREYRLRRDSPDIHRDAQGQPKEKNKYLWPPGRGNVLYCVPGTRAELLDNPTVPVAITEGEKKTIALYRLSWYRLGEASDLPRFVPLGLGGVWSFTGTIGKAPGEDGSRRDEKGLIPDLERVTWARRRVYIVYDTNVHTNTKVAAARRHLSSKLTERGAQVLWVNLPFATRGSGDERR